MSDKAAGGTRRKYTWEICTRAPRGVFKVGDREFVDQDFTRAERQALLTASTDGDLEALVLGALNARKVDPLHPDVTREWVDEQLSARDLYKAALRVGELVDVKLEGSEAK